MSMYDKWIESRTARAISLLQSWQGYDDPMLSELRRLSRRHGWSPTPTQVDAVLRKLDRDKVDT